MNYPELDKPQFKYWHVFSLSMTGTNCKWNIEPLIQMRVQKSSLIKFWYLPVCLIVGFQSVLKFLQVLYFCFFSSSVFFWSLSFWIFQFFVAGIFWVSGRNQSGQLCQHLPGKGIRVLLLLMTKSWKRQSLNVENLLTPHWQRWDFSPYGCFVVEKLEWFNLCWLNYHKFWFSWHEWINLLIHCNNGTEYRPATE